MSTIDGIGCSVWLRRVDGQPSGGWCWRVLTDAMGQPCWGLHPHPAAG